MRLKISTLFLCALCLAALPTFGQKVYVDYDRATAFSEYRTFEFRETRQDLRRVSGDAHRTVVKAITQYLTDGGLVATDADPDVYVAYYAAYARDLSLTLADLDYAYGPGFSLGSYWEGGVGTRQVSEKPFVFKEGTLVVDVWDRERKNLVWRGMATMAIKKDAAKNAKRIEKALDRLMAQWGKMYGDRARALREIKEEEGGS